ncbi:MAG: antitoxin [Armatimonadetes bacterium]|nr:antitoxin [Armatimonadota bacterium]
MPKISVSLPSEAIAFLDSMDENRSRAIATVVEEFRRRRREEDLEQAYDAYAELCRNEDADWWTDYESAATTDLVNDL